MGKAFEGFEDRREERVDRDHRIPGLRLSRRWKSRWRPSRCRSRASWSKAASRSRCRPGRRFLVVGRQEAGGTAFRRWVLFGSTPAVHRDRLGAGAGTTRRKPIRTPRCAPRSRPLRCAPRRRSRSSSARCRSRSRDLAGFRVARVIGGNAALLTDGPNDGVEVAEQPLVLIAVARGAPPSQPADRDRFARGVLSETPGIKEVRLMRSEPLRIGGAPGHEILAEAKDVKTGTDVMVAQWLRFGAQRPPAHPGVARKDGWTPTSSCALRDGARRDRSHVTQRCAGRGARIVVGRRLGCGLPRPAAPSGRPWRCRPWRGAAPARRSGSRAAPPARRCRPARVGSGTSNIAWCRCGSNFCPCGSSFCTPCFSSALNSSRSVSSTPSSNALTPALGLLADFRVERLQRALHVVGDRHHVARELGDPVEARIRHLALGAPAQVLHLGERPQQPVLQGSRSPRSSAAVGSAGGARALGRCCACSGAGFSAGLGRRGRIACPSSLNPHCD